LKAEESVDLLIVFENEDSRHCDNVILFGYLGTLFRIQPDKFNAFVIFLDQLVSKKTRRVTVVTPPGCEAGKDRQLAFQYFFEI
jgi:hypothetical protein